MEVKVTTFNVENLFNRYAFLDSPWEERNYEKFVQAVGVASIASREGDIVPYATTEIQRNNTAQAILDTAPNILAVQEIENIYTLRNFNSTFLDNYFDRIISIDGNDPRGIDVGFLIQKDFPAEIVNIRTHVDEAEKGKKIKRTSFLNSGYWVTGAIFSRDCLEVDVVIGTKKFTFLVNHLKAQDQTKASVERRAKQAQRVAELANQAVKSGAIPIVIGDFNVPPKKDKSLDALLKSQILKDPFPADTWTHYATFNGQISRLDYILVHKNVKTKTPDVFRKGLTTKCKQYVGDRYPTIGPVNTEASDHCPTSITIEI